MSTHYGDHFEIWIDQQAFAQIDPNVAGSQNGDANSIMWHKMNLG